jgi:hypothetical protein
MSFSLVVTADFLPLGAPPGAFLRWIFVYTKRDVTGEDVPQEAIRGRDSNKVPLIPIKRLRRPEVGGGQSPL